MNIKRSIGEVIQISNNILSNMSQEQRPFLPLRESEISKYGKASSECSPNSVFKLEMLAIPEIQEAFIEVLSLFPLGGKKRLANVHSWNAERVRDDCVKKWGEYGFENFIAEIENTVVTKCRPHKGECVLMNNHSYVKMMEVIYTAYIIGVLPTDVVMNLASGNTYWVNVWIANYCKRLYANDNGSDLAIDDELRQVHNYNEYQQGIRDKIDFINFDASKKFPYPDNMFDKVVSHSSIEHIDNWDSNVLPEIIRTLKHGGKCGLASVYHPLEREDFGRGQSSWWTKKKWERFVGLQNKLGFEIIGNTDYIYGLPWRSEEDTDRYKFKGSVYIANFIFFKKK